MAARKDRGKPVLAEKLVGQVALEQGDHSLHVVDAVRIVAETAVGAAHAEVAHDLQRQIPGGFGKLEGASTCVQGEVGHSDIPVVIAEEGEHPAETLGIVQRLRQALGFAEVRKDLRVLTVRDQRVAQLQPDVDGLLPHGRSIG